MKYGRDINVTKVQHLIITYIKHWSYTVCMKTQWWNYLMHWRVPFVKLVLHWPWKHSALFWLCAAQQISRRMPQENQPFRKCATANMGQTVCNNLVCQYWFLWQPLWLCLIYTYICIYSGQYRRVSWVAETKLFTFAAMKICVLHSLHWISPHVTFGNGNPAEKGLTANRNSAIGLVLTFEQSLL